MEKEGERERERAMAGVQNGVLEFRGPRDALRQQTKKRMVECYGLVRLVLMWDKGEQNDESIFLR